MKIEISGNLKFRFDYSAHKIIRAYFASSSNATIPAANGAAADVPV